MAAWVDARTLALPLRSGLAGCGSCVWSTQAAAWHGSTRIAWDGCRASAACSMRRQASALAMDIVRLAHSTWPHELLAVPLPVRQASAAAHAAAGLHEGRLGPAQRWWGRPRTAAWAAARCAACWCVVQGMGR